MDGEHMQIRPFINKLWDGILSPSKVWNSHKKTYYSYLVVNKHFGSLNPYWTMTNLRKDSGVAHTIGVELRGFWGDVVKQFVEQQQTCGQDAHIILPGLGRPIVQPQSWAVCPTYVYRDKTQKMLHRTFETFEMLKFWVSISVCVCIIITILLLLYTANI